MKSVVLYFFVLILLAGGLNHIINPKFYNRFIPGNLPKLMINYVSGVVEILLGIGLLFTATKYWSAWGVFILMIVFLPLHVIDLFRDKPAIGSKPVAVVRLVIQFLLIWGAWWLLVPYL